MGGAVYAGDAEERAARHRKAIGEWVAGHRAQVLDELTEFLKLPNDGKDLAAINANAAHLVRLLEKRGLETRLLDEDGPPYVFARLRPEGGPAPGKPVVLFYAHFDGQPVDAERWTVTAPHVPRLVGEIDDPDARLYGRSTSDDKGSIVGLLAAIDALRDAGFPPDIDAKFIFDPEEEFGSPHLAAVAARHADLLAADMLIFADGPVHQSGRPTAVFGCRGIVTVTLEMYGPARPLHSGHYGNWAPNPAEKLSELIASFKDADGRVRIEGFYDDIEPLSPREIEAIAAIPRIDDALARDVLIARTDGGGKRLEELINLPSLNVRGMASAWVGSQVRTIVPTHAVAEIDLRLVKGIDPAAQVERVRAHARKQGYTVVDGEPDEATRLAHPRVLRINAGRGVPAARTSMDTPLSRALIAAVTRAVEVEPVLMPTLGGTVPLSTFERALKLPVYGIPIANPDNNQHAPDENLRLGNLWDGIVVYASLLRMPAPGP